MRYEQMRKPYLGVLQHYSQLCDMSLHGCLAYSQSIRGIKSKRQQESNVM